MALFGKEEPEEVEVLDRALRCQVCEHTKFYTRKGTLHGAAASLLNIEWASPSCTCVICANCGYVHWFFPDGQ